MQEGWQARASKKIVERLQIDIRHAQDCTRTWCYKNKDRAVEVAERVGEIWIK